MRASVGLGTISGISESTAGDPGGIHFYNNGVSEAMSGSIRPFLRNGLNTGELSPSDALSAWGISIATAKTSVKRWPT